MKFGLFQTAQWPEGSSQLEDYRNALEQVVYADELGFESAWMTEHHFSRHGIISSNYAFCAYLAAKTKKIRLGPAVTVLPFHNPIRVAEDAATLDILSNGRLNFGIGRGYQWQEFQGFGIPMAEATARFEESVEVILKAWTSDEPFSHEGRYWSFPELTVEPKPLQKPHPPVWVAGMSADSIRRVAGHNWNLLMGQLETFDQIAAGVETYRATLQELGHGYNPNKIVLARAMYCAEDVEEARRQTEKPYMWFRTVAQQVASAPNQARSYQGGGAFAAPPDFEQIVNNVAIFGPPEFCIERIEFLRGMGFEDIIFFINFGGIEHKQVMRSLERFASQVMPHFKKEPVSKLVSR